MNASSAKHRTGIFPFLWLSLLCGPLFAAPGDLDSTFGTGGRAFVDFAGVWEGANAIVELTDGKLLVAREVVNFPSVDDFSVVRLTTTGSLDPTFASNGLTFV